MSSGQVKCVIFDCDGTLVDSEKLCCEALVQVFSQFNCTLTAEECLSHFKGGKLADILLETQSRHGLYISLDILEPLYRENVQKLFQAHLKPMPGAKELIHFLEQEGIEFCVASNAPKDKIELSLEMTGLYQSFKGKVFSAFDANSWKPEPDLIMYTAMNMGFLPQDCIYIDDTPKGVEAGVRAGIQTFRLCLEGRKTEDVDASVLNISRLEELQFWINDRLYLPSASHSAAVGL
ncbi:HAD family hydrolase [Vibrio sp. T187]|uniref:HAD-IA family hydrolase n=1 Tax=Vibrio TaxID=662 RepID=UPI0010C96CE8|nr:MULTISPECIES: HAD-IA family hydrolase [Vibrio]MBW3696217.1 HAD family hydrolase [Vibrio sp. T187]